MDPTDETGMTPQEFEEMAAKGEPVETVASRDEYLAVQARARVQVVSSFGNYDDDSGRQNALVTVAGGPPAMARYHPTLQEESSVA